MEETIKPSQQNDQTDVRRESISQLVKGRGKEDPQKSGIKKPDNQNRFRLNLWYFVGFFLLISMVNTFLGEKPQTIEFSEFKQKVISGEIKRVELGDKYYVGSSLVQADQQGNQQLGNSTQVYRTIPVNDSGFIGLLDANRVEYYTRPVSFGEMFGNVFLTWILPFGLMMGLWWFLSFRLKGGAGGVMSFGKNKAKLVSEGDTGVTFKDVAGADEAKEELVEVVDFLKNSTKFDEIGGKIPKGVLLIGTPGTGKTMLAKAVAGEVGVPFFKMSGADFVELFVGVGAARVRDLFQEARKNAPCIIFIDELDAIGKSRGASINGNDEREQTLNQLLVEMDGFDSKGGVIILAATNRPEILDPALLRPGRFDRQILVDRPDLKGRKAILEIHSKNVQVDEKVELGKIAAATVGFSGADLANLVNEAAILAVRNNRKKVMQADFSEAIEKLVAGLEKKSRVMNEKEKEIVAYHETGHALMAAFTPDADPVQKISIVPRGLAALGYTMQMPSEDRYLINEEELLGRVDVLLGGRAAEQIIFGRVSNGASNDLSRATDIVRKMISEYGMSDKFKNVYLGSNQTSYLGGMQTSERKEYSESTQNYIDEEIAKTINNRYERTLDLLKKKLDLLHKIAKRLLEIEVMDAEIFNSFLGTEHQAA
ncbi:ATP-dependent zinc metalloprotease FtsH [bacterium]|nr:ATP-dependent zinc metalloprotease FtsH [bacterium]